VRPAAATCDDEEGWMEMPAETMRGGVDVTCD
jgi:hypothetical protein